MLARPFVAPDCPRLRLSLRGRRPSRPGSDQGCSQKPLAAASPLPFLHTLTNGKCQKGVEALTFAGCRQRASPELSAPRTLPPILSQRHSTTASQHQEEPPAAAVFQMSKASKTLKRRCPRPHARQLPSEVLERLSGITPDTELSEGPTVRHHRLLARPRQTLRRSSLRPCWAASRPAPLLRQPPATLCGRSPGQEGLFTLCVQAHVAPCH